MRQQNINIGGVGNQSVRKGPNNLRNTFKIISWDQNRGHSNIIVIHRGKGQNMHKS